MIGDISNGMFILLMILAAAIAIFIVVVILSPGAFIFGEEYENLVSQIPCGESPTIGGRAGV